MNARSGATVTQILGGPVPTQPEGGRHRRPDVVDWTDTWRKLFRRPAGRHSTDDRPGRVDTPDSPRPGRPSTGTTDNLDPRKGGYITGPDDMPLPTVPPGPAATLDVWGRTW